METATKKKAKKTAAGSVICNRGAIAEALAVLLKIVTKRQPKPILECVKLETQDNRLILSATNLETAGMFTMTQVQVESAMNICVELDRLRRSVSEMSGDTVSLLIEGEQLAVRGSSGVNKLATMPSDDFPPCFKHDAKPDGTVEIAVDALQRILDEVIFAVSETGTRFSPAGIHLFYEKANLVAQATDGKVASETNSPAKGTGEFSCLVAPLPLQIALSVAHDKDDLAELSSGDNFLEIEVGDLRIRSNLIEGSFPPMRNYNSKDAATVVNVATAELLSAANQVGITVEDVYRIIVVSLSKNGITIESKSESGESKASVPCKVDGHDMVFGLNHKHLTTILRSCRDDPEITLRVFAPNRPVVFDRINTASRTGAYVVNMVCNLS